MRFEAQKCQPHLFMIMTEGYQLEDVTFEFIYLYRFSVSQAQTHPNFKQSLFEYH